MLRSISHLQHRNQETTNYCNGKVLQQGLHSPYGEKLCGRLRKRSHRTHNSQRKNPLESSESTRGRDWFEKSWNRSFVRRVRNDEDNDRWWEVKEKENLGRKKTVIEATERCPKKFRNLSNLSEETSEREVILDQTDQFSGKNQLWWQYSFLAVLSRILSGRGDYQTQRNCKKIEQ